MSLKETITLQVKNTEKILKEMRDEVAIMNKMIGLNDYEGFFYSSLKFQLMSEKNVNTSRGMPSLIGFKTAVDRVNDNIIDGSGVSVEFSDEGWFRLTIPSLLPKKNKGDTTYIKTTVMVALKDYFSKNTPHKFTDKCVLVVNNMYDYKRPDREYRDHDNVEIKPVIDLIAMFVLIDDHPMSLEHYYHSSPFKEDKTTFTIMPKKDFIKYLKKHEEEEYEI